MTAQFPQQHAFRPGIWVPLVTPFSHGEIDHVATVRLVHRLRRSGVHGLVVCGTTGEGPALSAYEKARLLATVLAAADDLPVVLALEGANTAKMIAEQAEIGAWPVRGYLLPPPSYVRPAEDGVRRHFLSLADALNAPIMIYDIPARTGVTLSAPLLAELTSTGLFPAIKACGLSARRLRDLAEIPGLCVFCGDDAWTLSAFRHGAIGSVSASAHVLPEDFVAFFDACRAGRFGVAEALWTTLRPIIELLFEEPNPAPVKAALALRGLIENNLRLPLTPCSADLQSRLMRAMAEPHALHLPDKSYK